MNKKTYPRYYYLQTYFPLIVIATTKASNLDSCTIGHVKQALDRPYLALRASLATQQAIHQGYYEHPVSHYEPP